MIRRLVAWGGIAVVVVAISVGVVLMVADAALSRRDDV
jgi:hypothetical protein